MAEGLWAADRDMTEALRVVDQSVGNLLERSEEVMALGTYMGQCVQSLQWQALQREMDYELAETGCTSTCSVYNSNKVTSHPDHPHSGGLGHSSQFETV